MSLTAVLPRLEVFLTVICTLGLVWVVVLRLWKIGHREAGLPPGPPTVPILGNLLIVPLKNHHLQFTEWAKTYGEVFSLKVASSTIVVLNSARAMRMFLEVNGASTSSRPPLYTAIDLYTEDYLVFAPYGSVMKSMRRCAHEVLSREACEQHRPIQQAEAAQLMHDLLTGPEDFPLHLYRYTVSVVSSIMFGTRSPTSQASIVVNYSRILHELSEYLRPGAHPPIDMIPWLKYIPEFLPGGAWKVESRNLKGRRYRLFHGLVQTCRTRMDNHRRNGCFMEKIIDEAERYGLNEKQIMDFGSAIQDAGTETTASVLQHFIRCMVVHPDVQRKGQEEIDSVIGHDRCPSLDDIKDLPYVRAIIQEVLRIHTVVPTGVPHATTSDLMIDGYFIPKGTTIFSNVWGLNRNEDVFEGPSVFNPDRFMASTFGTKSGVDTSDFRTDLGFGHGRRICPGLHLAMNSINLNVMNFLWAFNLDYALDPLSKARIPIDINAYDVGLVLAPKKFKCSITSRTPNKENLIRAQLSEARDVFDQFEFGLDDIKWT